MSLILRVLALLLVMFVSRNADLLDRNGAKYKRETTNINADWEYLENNAIDLHSISSEEIWQQIDLPHTWNQWDAVDLIPGYRRDASWYRKKLEIDKMEETRYLLYFEGANISTEVFVNGKQAGSHIGGYLGFEVDITSYLSGDGENEILVRVDNAYNPEVIPSQKSDFFIYGGITRDVWLKRVPEKHIDDIRVSTPEVNASSANAEVRISFSGMEHCENCEAAVKIIDPDSGEQIAMKSVEIENNDEVLITFNNLTDIKLWSPKDPNLYTIEVALNQNEKLIDKLDDRLGFRWFSFEENGPFFLNGKRLLLRGTHRHEEHAGYGAAMPNELHRKDIQMIKDLGANFLRLGHYPQDPEIYKLCDELGLIVWDELPWCRGGVGNDEWKRNTKHLFREQIKQNFNHPSIFFWSLGNEIYWLSDFENGDDTEALNAFVSDLNIIAHELDPGRLTAIRKYYDGANLVDVFSPSIWSGWYAGVYTNYEKSLKESAEKYPAFLHMEYGGSSHVGRHTETPISASGMLRDDEWEEVSNQVNIKNIAKEGDWTENYIVDLFDWHLKISETMPGFTGNAQWAFKDFGTPLRPENSIPYVNQKGLVDRDGNPKDAYYVFKSYWSEEPMVYIESHTWTDRQGPENKARTISLFSNCQKVELFHNGISKGIKQRNLGDFPASGLTWDITFVEGDNRLKAMAYNDEALVSTDEMSVKYTYTQAGKADHVLLKSSPLPNGNLLVEALMMDKNDQRVLNYENKMYFSLDGTGELLVNYGTPNRSQVIEMANGRAAIEMIPGDGPAVVEARNQDFKGSYLKIPQKDAAAQALIMVQPCTYNDEEKTKVIGPYQNLEKVAIPKSLTGQNKWFMFEGPVLENDKIAYRFYADYRHRFDIYGKKVSDLVMDTVSWNYHNLMDWGSDILKVGNSLGIGSPGIYYEDSVYTLSDWGSKSVEVLESGNEVAAIRTVFKNLNISGQTFDVIQDWSLKTGDLYAEVKVWVDGGALPAGMKWATGIVKHLDGFSKGESANCDYLYSWGEQSFHDQNLGMAVIVPQMYEASKVEDKLSHLYVFNGDQKGVKYRFLAGWAEGVDGAKTQAEFEKQVKQACENY